MGRSPKKSQENPLPVSTDHLISSETPESEAADLLFFHQASQGMMAPTLCRKAVANYLGDGLFGLAFGSAGIYLLDTGKGLEETPVAAAPIAIAVPTAVAMDLVVKLTDLIEKAKAHESSDG